MVKNRVVITNVLLSLIFVSLFASCGSETPKVEKKEASETTRALEKLSINNFEEDFKKIDLNNFEEELKSLESKYSLFFASNRPLSEWEIRAKNEKLSDLSDSLVDLFNNKYEWKEDLNKASVNYQKEFINDVMPEVYLWNSAFEMNEGVWGYNNQLILAMEQYLGEGHPFYDQLPRYIAFQRNPKFISRDLIKNFAESKSLTDSEDFTFLNQMLKAGKAYYFTEKMLDGISDGDLLKYNEEKLQWIEENESEVWKYFVNQELLFSTERKVGERFLAEAPFSKFNQDFDNKTPGRVGEWIGLQIIRSLAKKNPEMSLETIMGITDAQSILTLSKYKP